jgi:hypothetical protein
MGSANGLDSSPRKLRALPDSPPKIFPFFQFFKLLLLGETPRPSDGGLKLLSNELGACKWNGNKGRAVKRSANSCKTQCSPGQNGYIAVDKRGKLAE